jgi:hypothetical protein
VQYPWRLKQNGNSGPEAIVRLAQSLNALQEIAQAATGTPGRKNIIWVGKGVPSVDLTGLAEASAKPLLDAVRRCTDMLLRARVTLYIVDPTPLSSTQYDTETPSDLATIEEENWYRTVQQRHPFLHSRTNHWWTGFLRAQRRRS